MSGWVEPWQSRIVARTFRAQPRGHASTRVWMHGRQSDAQLGDLVQVTTEEADTGKARVPQHPGRETRRN